MVAAVVTLARARNLFGVVVLSGVYSFLMATVLVALDAVDVAMTEAAVGAGISTVLFLGALFLCRSEETKPAQSPWLPLAASIAVGALLMYGTLGLPGFADSRTHQCLDGPRSHASHTDYGHVSGCQAFRGSDAEQSSNA